jgi:hypothetical protein
MSSAEQVPPEGEAEGQPARRSRAKRGASVAPWLAAHWQIFALVAIVAIGFLVRLYYLHKYTEYTADSYYFMLLARSIRTTFTYTIRGAPHTKYLPGYPGAIWLGSYVLGGIQNSANVLAITGGALTAWVTYGIGNELFDKYVGVIAALIVALQPTFLKWTSLPMTEGIFTLFFALGVYLMLTGVKRGSIARRLLGMACGGYCLLVRWEGVLFLPLAVLLIIIYFKESKFRWWEVPLMIVLFAGPIGVYAVRNLIATGKITAYEVEYQGHAHVTIRELAHRFKVYAFLSMSSLIFSVFFYLGAVVCLLMRKWKAFFIVGGWFALYVVFHMAWYYTYERFMAPAVPAVALFCALLVVAVFRYSYKAPEILKRREKSDKKRPASAGKAIRWVGCTVAVASLVVLLVVGMFAASRTINTDAQAFADDHGGKGMQQASDWLHANAPGAIVGVDAGPYFDWLYDGGVLYTRPVPWDLPVEDRDVDGPHPVEMLWERGASYMVVGQTENGVPTEIATISIRNEELSRLREVARFDNDYTVGKDQEHLTTVVYRILPPK